uniref:17beta-estradiol 17-dehydrogenase n=1 Tax=Nomascus leucogenys TaxID=61853 RepID=A0A2I3H5E4_NOMLE
MESALPTASFLYWVGTGTVANLTLHICYSGVGNELEVGPGLGEWAVVTGSTDAIGKSYAEELAKRGMMVVLISRLQDKLDQVSREIKEKFKVEDPKYFLDIPDLDNMIKKMININILSVCKMTQLVSKGANLNLSAGRGMFPVPLLTICSATKTFVDFFSQCLHGEYRSKSIFVQSVLPYFVATKLAKIRKPTLDDHALKGLIISILPSWIYFKITMSTRDHYLRKNKKN